MKRPGLAVSSAWLILAMLCRGSFALSHKLLVSFSFSLPMSLAFGSGAINHQTVSTKKDLRQPSARGGGERKLDRTLGLRDES